MRNPKSKSQSAKEFKNSIAITDSDEEFKEQIQQMARENLKLLKPMLAEAAHLTEIVGKGLYSRKNRKQKKIKTEPITLRVPINCIKYAKNRTANSGEQYTEYLEFFLASTIYGHIEEDAKELAKELAPKKKQKRILKKTCRVGTL